MDNNKYKILLVEDNDFLSYLLKNKLQKGGFDVVRAEDGEKAVNILKNTKVDLILLDLILPKKSGFEVMEQIKQDPQLEKAPIIIISNLGQPEDIQKGKELGAIEYFIKAKTSIDDLVYNISKFLSNLNNK